MTVAFRIIPRQDAAIDENGHGFIFEGRLFKWREWETAMMAAHALGLDPWMRHVVSPAQVWKSTMSYETPTPSSGESS